MFINELNSRLKYINFYNMPNENWSSHYFYATLDNNLANNYDWLNTFKDKIKFFILYDEKKIKLKFIKCFIDKYYSRDWYMILLKQNITPQFLNNNYKHINCIFDSRVDNKIIYTKLLNIAHKLKPEIWANLQYKFINLK